jgi:hypothetical protein
MEELVYLIVQAVNAVDQRHEEEAAEARQTAADAATPTLEDIARLYAETTGQWRGCDWATSFGSGCLDLNGVSSELAEARATATRKPESDWHDAALWLARIERYACEAEHEAAKAVAAAQTGAWASAANHAERAFALEFATGRSLWSRPAHTWHALHQAMRAATSTHKPLADFSDAY